MLSQPQVKTASSGEEPVKFSGHCRRTAAVARLIGHQLFLPSEEKDLLRAACLLHHHNVSALPPEETELLLADIFGGNAQALSLEDRSPDVVRGVLSANDIPGAATPLESRLASILWLADAFDQHMKAPPSEADEVGGIIEQLRGGVEAGTWPKESIDALVHSTSPVPIGPWHVPVFPQAALRTLSLMRDPRVCLADVVDAAKMDPAIAGLIMQLANSALFGSRAPIATLSNAIGRLGFEVSQRVIIAAALRPVFSSPKLQATWQHSLEVADLSEQLAASTGTIVPAEAYLAGLVHDVGRIALLAMRLYDSARLQGLLHGGCPQVYAEKLLLRTDHAALGAQIAAEWRLPETMVTAIRYHHRPERAENPLAYLLYVAEYLTGAEEDLLSASRLETSLNGIGLEWDDVQNRAVSSMGSWLAAAYSGPARRPILGPRGR